MQIDKELYHTYSDGLTGKKIVLLGPYPPPLGGVAVHVMRVMEKLKRQNNVVRCFDTTARHRWRYWLYLIKLIFFLLSKRPDYVIYNTIYLANSMPEMQMVFSMQKLMKYKIMYVEHDCRHMYQRDTMWKKSLSTLLQGHALIMIGDSTYRSYIENGIKIPCVSFVESAFLPPDFSREQEIVATYPASMPVFIEQSQPLIVANAFQLSLLNGRDLYGLDLCINLMSRLVKTYSNVGLVLAIAQTGDEAYYKKLCDMIEREQLKDHVYFLQDQKELWPLFKQADLFVRPTLSDSFGISVAEALCLGTPAVASDVCIRPAGTILFRQGDREDFYKKVTAVLQEGAQACWKKQGVCPSEQRELW